MLWNYTKASVIVLPLKSRDIGQDVPTQHPACEWELPVLCLSWLSRQHIPELSVKWASIQNPESWIQLVHNPRATNVFEVDTHLICHGVSDNTLFGHALSVQRIAQCKFSSEGMADRQKLGRIYYEYKCALGCMQGSYSFPLSAGAGIGDIHCVSISNIPREY